MGQNIEQEDADALFDEWTGMFRRHRDSGWLAESDRERFRAIGRELRRRGLLDTSDMRWAAAISGRPRSNQR